MKKGRATTVINMSQHAQLSVKPGSKILDWIGYIKGMHLEQ